MKGRLQRQRGRSDHFSERIMPSVQEIIGVALILTGLGLFVIAFASVSPPAVPTRGPGRG
jgi:hypothetical protein